MTTETSSARDCGHLIGIARRSARRAPMVCVLRGEISRAAGLAGDHKGLKFKARAITVLALEDWTRALADLGLRPEIAGLRERAEVGPSVEADEDGTLSWTERRANLLISGLDLPKAVGGRLAIGRSVVLEVTHPCQPCRRMDDVRPGLLKALHPDWRGGVTARVVVDGPVALGDAVRVLTRPERRVRRLP